MRAPRPCRPGPSASSTARRLARRRARTPSRSPPSTSPIRARSMPSGPVLVSYDNTRGGRRARHLHRRERAAARSRHGRGRRVAPGHRSHGRGSGRSFAAEPSSGIVRLADGRTLQRAARWSAADGRASRLRDAAGISVVGWSYPQIGIVTTVGTRSRTTAAPCSTSCPPAVCHPAADPRQSLVHHLDRGRARGARAILALDDAGFLAEVERRFGYRLGAIALAGRARRLAARHASRPRPCRPTALRWSATPRIGVHPIAGQGLNLGLRDVAALAEVIADAARLGLDIGSSATSSATSAGAAPMRRCRPPPSTPSTGSSPTTGPCCAPRATSACG